MMKMMKMRATPFLVVAFLLATVFSCKKDDNSNNDDSGSGSGDDGQTQTEVQVTAEYFNSGTSGAMYQNTTGVTLDEDGLNSGVVKDLGESHYIKVHIVLSNTEEGQAYQYSYKLDDPSSEDYGLFNRLTEKKPLSQYEFYDVPPSGEFDLYFFGNRVSDVTARLRFIKADDPDEVVVASTQEPLKFHISEKQEPVISLGDATYVSGADEKSLGEYTTPQNWIPDTDEVPNLTIPGNNKGGSTDDTPTPDANGFVCGSFRFIPGIEGDTPEAGAKVGDESPYQISYSVAEDGNPSKVDFDMCLLDDNKLVAASGATDATDKVKNAQVIAEGDKMSLTATKNGTEMIWGFGQVADGSTTPNSWLFRLNENLTSATSISLKFNLLTHITEDTEGGDIDAYIKSSQDAKIILNNSSTGVAIKALPVVTP